MLFLSIEFFLRRNLNNLMNILFNVHFKHIAINDEFVKQASVCRQLEHYNLDTNSIIKEVNNG